MSGLGFAEFLDYAAAGSCAGKVANGLQVAFGVNNGDPGDAVVEHGSGGHQEWVIQGDIEGIGREQVAEFAAGDVAAFLRGNDGDAGDQIVDVVFVQGSPEALLFVEN